MQKILCFLMGYFGHFRWGFAHFRGRFVRFCVACLALFVLFAELAKPDTPKPQAKPQAKTQPKAPQAKSTQKPKSTKSPQKTPAKTNTKAKPSAKSKTPAKSATKSKTTQKSQKAKKYTPKPLPNEKEVQDIASKAKVINYGEPNLARLKRALEGKNELKILVFGDSHIAGDTLTHQWRKTIMLPNSVGFIYPVFPTYHQNLLVKTISKDFEVRNSRIDAYDDYPFGGVIARAKKENASVKITLKFPPEHQDFLIRIVFKAPNNTLGAFLISDSSGQSYRLQAKEANIWEISQDFALRFPIEIKSLLPNATLGGYFIYQDSKNIADTSRTSKSRLSKLEKLPINEQKESELDSGEEASEQSSQDKDDSQNPPKSQNPQKFSYANLTNLPKNTNNLIAHIGSNGARSDIWRKWNQKALSDTLCAFRYDFIVLSYGSNDALVMPLDTKAFEQNYSSLITLVRKCNEGAAILLVGPPKVITKPRKAKNYRIAPYFVAVRESVKKVAKKEGVLYFDMHEFMEDSGGKDAWVAKSLSKKDVHLTPFGYSLVADGIAYGLHKVLNIQTKEIKESMEAKESKDTKENAPATKTNKSEQKPELNTPDESSAPQEIWQSKIE